MWAIILRFNVPPDLTRPAHLARVHFQATVVQLDAWRGLATPDINSNSVMSDLPPDCQALDTPRCEDETHLPGPGETCLLRLYKSAQ